MEPFRHHSVSSVLFIEWSRTYQSFCSRRIGDGYARPGWYSLMMGDARRESAALVNQAPTEPSIAYFGRVNTCTIKC